MRLQSLLPFAGLVSAISMHIRHLLSGCFSLGVIDLTKSCGVIKTSDSPCSFITFRVAKYLKILSGVE